MTNIIYVSIILALYVFFVFIYLNKKNIERLEKEELKILETFYYHTSFDNLYITEIRQALIET